MSDHSMGSASFGVLVPAKPPRFAKSRLSTLGEPLRRELARAFALDTVVVALSCPEVARVLVVTDDHLLAAAMADLGAEVLPDGTSEDLNGALVLAAKELLRRHPRLRVAALCADLPALQGVDLSRALTAASLVDRAFVADADAVGTTMVSAAGLDGFRPAFGPGSRRAHLDDGLVELDESELSSLRRDVDTAADLEAARAWGLGPHTSWALTQHLDSPEPRTEASREVQATVAHFDEASGSGLVFLDDGTELDFGAPSWRDGSIRLLRSGQRVRLQLSGEDDSRVLRLRLLTVG